MPTDEIRRKDRERYQREKPKRLAAVKRWALANPEKARSYGIKSRFNLTQEQYEAMIEAQHNLCAICQTPMNPPVVDHDHTCCPGKKSCGKCVRGLLCRPCNTNLGVLESWAEKNREAIERYLDGENER